MATVNGWKRIEAGKVTRIENDSVVDLAKSEGTSARLVTIRVKASKAFASPVATYEPIWRLSDEQFMRSGRRENDPERAAQLAMAAGDLFTANYYAKMVAERK